MKLLTVVTASVNDVDGHDHSHCIEFASACCDDANYAENKYYIIKSCIIHLPTLLLVVRGVRTTALCHVRYMESEKYE